MSLNKARLCISVKANSLYLLMSHFEVLLHHFSHRFPPDAVAKNRACRSLNLLDSECYIRFLLEVDYDTRHYFTLNVLLQLLLSLHHDAILLSRTGSLEFFDLSNLQVEPCCCILQ